MALSAEKIMCNTDAWNVLEEIIQEIENGNQADVIYLDLCKAFNKVPHLRLLKYEQMWNNR